jgi:hypothetical protein
MCSGKETHHQSTITISTALVYSPAAQEAVRSDQKISLSGALTITQKLSILYINGFGQRTAHIKAWDTEKVQRLLIFRNQIRTTGN